MPIIAARTSVITPDDIQLKENLSFEVPPMSIGGKSTKLLRGKEIPLVKMIWNQKTGDATWEREDQMRELYPDLFVTSFEDETLLRGLVL
jgi:hypothetical protein